MNPGDLLASGGYLETSDPNVADAALEAANHSRFHTTIIHVRAEQTKEEVLGEFSRGLAFPYFGGNWDALSDCLRDLSWIPNEARLIVVEVELSADRAVVSPLLSVLQAAGSFWAVNTPRTLMVVHRQATERSD